jgi:hypothetical protein
VLATSIANHKSKLLIGAGVLLAIIAVAAIVSAPS